MTRLAPTTLALLAVAVVAVSFSGPVMASLTVPALAISFWRNALAAGLLAPAALGRRWHELRELSPSEIRSSVAAGVLLALHFGTWVTSLRMTSVAASTAIVCFQVVWVAGWDRLRGVRLPGAAVVGLLVALVGVLVITGVDLTVSGRAVAGDLLALVGSLAVAAYTVVGARARRTVSTTTYTFGCYGTASVGLLLACLATGADLAGYRPQQWLLLAVVTLTAQLLGHSVFNHLLDTISPMLVSLALLLEIPGASIVAAVLLEQLPPAGVVVGLVMILAGTATVVVAGPRAPDEPPLA